MLIGRIFSWEVNPATRAVVWSDNTDEVVGFPLSDDLEITFQMIHPDDRQATVETINQAIERKAEFEFEFRLVNPADGEALWFYCKGEMTGGTADGQSRLVGVTQNVTERKRREANQAFLADIANEMSRLSTAREIMETVGAKIGAYLAVESCLFVDVDDARGEVSVFDGWNAADVPSLRYRTIRLADFINEEFARANRAGEGAVVRDTRTDPRCEDGDYSALGIAAFVTVPFHRRGVWTNYLAVTDSKPRDWRDDEIELFRELSNRIFSRLERARAEEALRDSEVQMSAIFSEAEVGLSQISLDGYFLRVNPTLCRILGRSAEQLLGFNFTDVTFSEDVPVSLEGVKRLIETGKPVSIDKRYLHASGGIVWANSRLSLLKVKENQPPVILAVTAVLTARKQAEEALRESEERLSLLIKSVEDYAIITLDIEGIINGWNPGAEKMFGYTASEIIGQNFEILFTPANRKQGIPAKEMQRALKTGSAEDERFHLRKDGSRFYVSGVLHPLKDGKTKGFVKIARDMTERIKAEKAQRDREILQRLVQAQEDERKRIARDLHDELGQQLTGLRLKLESVRRLREDDEELSAVIDETQIMAKSIDDGVDFLTWELRPSVLDDLGLSSALEKYVREWSDYSGVAAKFIGSVNKGIRFAPEIEINLYRIIQEALNNVNKHAKASSADVFLDKRGDSIVLIVEDDGVGFDPENNKTHSKNLGLLGMKERAELIGGTIEIESTLKKGTTVHIRIKSVEEILPED